MNLSLSVLPKQLVPKHAQMLQAEDLANAGGEVPNEKGPASSRRVLMGIRIKNHCFCGFELNRLNHRTKAKTIESRFILEITATQRASVFSSCFRFL